MPVLHTAGGALWLYARNWDRAEADCRKAIGLDLTSAFPHVLLGLVHAARGSYFEAVAEQERALDLLGVLHPFPVAALGCVSASAGRVREAGEVLDQLGTLATRVAVSRFHFAAVHAAIGNIDEAFNALDEACEARDGWLLALRVHPWMDPLRRDARFAQVLSRMNSD
jgi:tetratricopeptide (TPR) repeat protein